MSNKILGLEKLLAKFDRLSDIAPEIARGLEKSCMRIEADAKRNCPVDDGTLRASITHEVNKSTLTAVVGTNVEYAPYVEFGTGIHNPLGRKTPWTYKTAEGKWYTTDGQSPQPFLYPAFNKNKKHIVKDIQDSINLGRG